MGNCYSYKSVVNDRQEQLESNGEVMMLSSSNICFINSQTLEEDNMWLYKFRFLCGAMTRNSSGMPVDFLYKARINLKALTNIENQYYDISDEYLKLGSTTSEEGIHVGKYKGIVNEIAGIIVDKISEKLSDIEATKPIGKALSWAWSAATLGPAIAECFATDENDFTKNEFYREWTTKGKSDFAQYWEVGIEIPPGKTVEFQFSYDIWSSSNEKLEGTPITCKISAPANLKSTNNYKGVTYLV